MKHTPRKRKRSHPAATSPTSRPVWNPEHYHVYVIELDPKVLTQKRFTEENPQHDPAKPCLYVGMTGKSPELRFEQHLAGYKSCKYSRRYGRRLIPELYLSHNPMRYDDARAREASLAEELRQQGHAVWQR